MTNLTQRILQKPILRSQLLRLALTSLVLMALQANPISAQWSSDANNNVYKNPTTGNVGIGTSSPAELFHLNVPGPSVAQIRFQADQKAGYIGAWSGGGLFITSNRSLRTGEMFNPANGGAQISLGSGYEDGNILFQTVSSSGIVTTLTRINANGNVGIGVTNPQFKLDVNGGINASGNINATGNITASGTIQAKYQDVAEWVQSSQQLLPGAVAVLDQTKSNQVISSTLSYDTRVAGVISEQPGIALGESGDNKVLVATTGRVRVNVDANKGPIHIGDLLVTSDVPGMAMKSEPIKVGKRLMHMPGTLIGKALEPLEQGSGKILVLLSLQ